jgi:hypothetical protein
MTYRGRVKNGVVVLDGQALIPEGTEVSVEPLQSGRAESADAGLSPLFEVWKRAKSTGLPDLALNHDHYLYGYPKVKP